MGLRSYFRIRSFTIMNRKAAPQYVGVSHRYPEFPLLAKDSNCTKIQIRWRSQIIKSFFTSDETKELVTGDRWCCPAWEGDGGKRADLIPRNLKRKVWPPNLKLFQNQRYISQYQRALLCEYHWIFPSRDYLFTEKVEYDSFLLSPWITSETSFRLIWGFLSISVEICYPIV